MYFEVCGPTIYGMLVRYMHTMNDRMMITTPSRAAPLARACLFFLIIGFGMLCVTATI